MVDPNVYRYLKDATGQLPKTKLIIDHNDSVSTKMSGSVVGTSTERLAFDENLTEYALFPYTLNEPPIIVESINDASEPKIYNAVNWLDNQKAMYINEEGAVIVASGASFKLKIKAQQPESLNSENGVPIVAANEGNLTYTWTFNGTEIPQFTDDTIDNFAILGDTLSIKQINKSQAGAYSCAVSNDAGTIVTTPLLIQVFDPYATETAIFRKNLITNPILTDGTSGWTVSTGELQAPKLEQSNRQQGLSRVAELKQVNNSEGIEYIPQMFDPQINTVSYPALKNIEDDTYFSLSPLLSGEGGYLTRGPLTYNAADGKHITIAYQDIDLTTVQDYIAGKVFGIDGVKAYFSCYLGNSISRVVPTEGMETREERSDKSNYWEGGPRLSLENILLTGRPYIEESLQVYIQEFSGNELLKSSLYNPKKNTSYTSFEPKLIDPINSICWTLSNNETVSTEDGLITLQTNSHDAKVAKTFELAYNDRRNYYTNGQVVKQDELIFDKLNPKTDRVRVTLKYQLGGGRFFDLNSDAVQSTKLLEFVSYENAYKKGLLELTGKSLLQAIREKGGNYTDASMQKAYPDGSVPRAMATGFVFTMSPIIADNPTTTSNVQYKSRVVRVEEQLDIKSRIPNLFSSNTVPFAEKYLQDYSRFKFLKYELRSQQQPSTQPSPSWVSPLDWRDSTQVWKAIIDLKQVDKKTKQANTIPVDTYEPFDIVVADKQNPNYNTYNFNTILDLTKPRKQKAKFADLQGINLRPIVDGAVQIQPSELSTYLTSEYSANVSPTTLALRNWIQQSYKDSITNVVNDNRDLAQHKTFKVVFNMLHADQSGVLTNIGTATKYLIAGKSIDLRFKDFIAENALPTRYDYARKTFIGERSVYVVPVSMTQVFKLETWLPEDHLQAIPNLQSKIQNLIDNITWGIYYYYDSDGSYLQQSWKDRIESLTVDSTYDFTASSTIQSILDVVLNEAELYSWEEGLDTLATRLTQLRNNEGRQSIPQGTVYIESNVADYTNKTANTPTQGFIDIAFSKTNDDIYIYDYAIRSISEREL